MLLRPGSPVWNIGFGGSMALGFGAEVPRAPADAASGAAPRHETVRLSEYAPPPWLVRRVDLRVELRETGARVEASLTIERNEAASGGEPARPDLRLDGRAMRLLTAEIDGASVLERAVRDDEGITVAAADLPGDAFTWRAVTEIDPRENTALEGLYMSRDMFCTQCEAQGFRKITYFTDRPDVMSVYTCRVEADREKFPVLLSNGEPVDRGDLAGGRHYVTWRDPWPKPSYLFALVAGDLSPTNDTFTTQSGRRVALTLFTRRGDEGKSAYALDALKRSMAWDETTYGREYDLDLFMIVAVDDFNMGAMENKGLNVFNSKYVLASPETATDRDYEIIESVVAHEYFHNWTGNRITCRDWFQLCLKEGLTVFRDQQFSEDMRSAAVQRIDHVRALRTRQLREDDGPLAHPVRPDSYIEINNFYTATVYEKGAEIVRMLHTIFGPQTYRAALDLYFERHDGQAATLEDFVACFEDVSEADLAPFFVWWTQAGAPRIHVTEHYDPDAGRYRLQLRQETAPTPGQADKQPVIAPLRYGLLRRDGSEIFREDETGDVDSARDRRILLLDQTEKTFEIGGLSERPVLSLNRGFSAPVVILRDISAEDRALLLAHDADPFSRWEAGRGFAVDVILGVDEDIAAARAPRSVGPFAAALGQALSDPTADPAFRALLLSLPGEDELVGDFAAWRRRWVGDGDPATLLVDPDRLHAARKHVRSALAETLQGPLQTLFAEMATPGRYAPDAVSAGKRALKNAAMTLLAARETEEGFARAEQQFAEADNMTDQLPALTALVHGGASSAEAALDGFFRRWRRDALVLGKWFGVQATAPRSDAVDTVERLTRHGDFDWKNPNKFRALIGAFAMGNPRGFHRRDGAGYRFFADWLLRLDPINPQTSAKLVAAFEAWRRYDEGRQALMRGELERIAAAPTLSRDMSEMVGRILNA